MNEPFFIADYRVRFFLEGGDRPFVETMHVATCWSEAVGMGWSAFGQACFAAGSAPRIVAEGVRRIDVCMVYESEHHREAKSNDLATTG